MLLANRLSYIKAALINEVDINSKKFKFEELSFEYIDDAFIKSFDGEDITIGLGGIQRILNFRGVLSAMTYSGDVRVKHPYEFHLAITLLEGIVIHASGIGFLSPQSREFKNSESLELSVGVGSSTYEHLRKIGNSLNKNGNKELAIIINGSPGRYDGLEKFMVTSMDILNLDIDGQPIKTRS